MLRITHCANCGRARRHAYDGYGGRCGTCARHWRRHGTERVPRAYHAPYAGEPCADCGEPLWPGTGARRGRCQRCYGRAWGRVRYGRRPAVFWTACYLCGLPRRGKEAYCQGLCHGCYVRLTRWLHRSWREARAA